MSDLEERDGWRKAEDLGGSGDAVAAESVADQKPKARHGLSSRLVGTRIPEC